MAGRRHHPAPVKLAPAAGWALAGFGWLAALKVGLALEVGLAGFGWVALAGSGSGFGWALAGFGWLAFPLAFGWIWR